MTKNKFRRIKISVSVMTHENRKTSGKYKKKSKEYFG